MSNNIKNKRGLSEIVALVLVMLITILAVTILAGVLIRIAKAPQLSPQYNCLQESIKQSLEVQSTCYNPQTKDVQVKIKRSLQNSEVQSINFILKDQIISKEFQCGNFCGSCQIVQQGNIQTYYIYSAEMPEEVSIKANNCLISTKQIKNC